MPHELSPAYFLTIQLHLFVYFLGDSPGLCLFQSQLLEYTTLSCRPRSLKILIPLPEMPSFSSKHFFSLLPD